MNHSSCIEHELTVRWKHRVFFTDNAFEPENLVLVNVLREASTAPARVLFVIDDALAIAQPDLLHAIDDYTTAHARFIHRVRPPMIIEGGERVKNSHHQVTAIHSAIDAHHIDRHSVLIAIGGGALLDMAGLAAATAHRGIRHVRMPSTTLSQADSGVGVKNGINAFGKKNFIGTFAPPHAVVNDFQLLATLPQRDFRCGFVEAVKVACIRDATFFKDIEQDLPGLSAFSPPSMRKVIHRSAALHAHHIATCGDPFETGSARPLDFGHWAAHKLEQMSDYRLRHGEAVAIGIALDTLYSRDIGLLPATEADRVLAVLEQLGFDLFVSELLREDLQGQLQVLSGLTEFKEHLGGELTITLLNGIGNGIEVHAMNSNTILDGIRELKERHDQRSHRISPARSLGT